MPIGIDEFDELDSGDDHVSNAERVIGFLVQNREHAFKATEIAAETGVSENSIHPVLNRLEDRDLVRHKEPYWAIGDLDHVREAFVFHSSVTFLDDELGPESREQWVDAASTDERADDRS